MTFGAKLENARLMAGLSLEDLAKNLQFNKRNLQEYETGQRNPPGEGMLFRLAKEVNVHPAKMLEWAREDLK